MNKLVENGGARPSRTELRPEFAWCRRVTSDLPRLVFRYLERWLGAVGQLLGPCWPAFGSRGRGGVIQLSSEGGRPQAARPTNPQPAKAKAKRDTAGMPAVSTRVPAERFDFLCCAGARVWSPFQGPARASHQHHCEPRRLLWDACSS